MILSRVARWLRGSPVMLTDGHAARSGCPPSTRLPTLSTSVVMHRAASTKEDNPVNEKPPFPELQPHEGSWVVTREDTMQVREFWPRQRELVERLHAAKGYHVETVGAYLARINAGSQNR